jgi:hypothetical protein
MEAPMALISHGKPEPSSPANCPESVLTLDGQFLAKNRWSQDARARLVINYLDGKVDFVNLCIKQLAALCRVRLSHVQRMRNGNGKRKNGNRNRKNDNNYGSLAEHLMNSTPVELIEAAKVLGVDQVWDRMVLPIIAEEKAAAK